MAFDALDAGARPTALCALAAEIRPQFQGLGLANRILDVMSDPAHDAQLSSLIAPVRPSWKDRYPLTPIEHYVEWTREDGQPFDPWIRVHTRRGAIISKPVAKSMFIDGTVAEWQQWTGMRSKPCSEPAPPASAPSAPRTGRVRSTGVADDAGK